MSMQPAETQESPPGLRVPLTFIYQLCAPASDSASVFIETGQSGGVAYLPYLHYKQCPLNKVYVSGFGRERTHVHVAGGQV